MLTVRALSEEEIPESILAKKMRKYMAVLQKKSGGSIEEDPEKVVMKLAEDDRAVELLEKLKQLYPDIYKILVSELYKLAKAGQLKSLNGLTVYAIIKQLGLDIRPEIRIRFVKHGKEVDFKDYLGS